jgi:hypothetical protein
MEKIKNEFLQIISEIEQIHGEYLQNFKLKEIKEWTNSSLVMKNLIFSEILTILKILYEELNDLYEVSEKLSQIVFLKGKSIREREEEIKLVDRQFEVIDKLKVHIKVLYEWLNHLRNLIIKSSSSKKILTLIPNNLMKELERYCVIRHKLITHKEGFKASPIHSMLYSSKWGDVKLEIITPLFINEAQEEMDKLWEECKGKLEKEEIIEKNFKHRREILYKNLGKNKFSPDQEERIKSFIGKYGGVTDEPIEIARYIKNLVQEFIPKLAYFNE